MGSRLQESYIEIDSERPPKLIRNKERRHDIGTNLYGPGLLSVFLEMIGRLV